MLQRSLFYPQMLGLASQSCPFQSSCLGHEPFSGQHPAAFPVRASVDLVNRHAAPKYQPEHAMLTVSTYLKLGN